MLSLPSSPPGDNRAGPCQCRAPRYGCRWRWMAGLPPSNGATNAGLVFPAAKLFYIPGKDSSPSGRIHSHVFCPALISQFVVLFLTVCGSAQISCRLARALACRTERIFLSSRSIGLIIQQIIQMQKIILHFQQNAPNSANSSAAPGAYLFHQGERSRKLWEKLAVSPRPAGEQKALE